MDLQQYCSELDKVFKQKHNSEATVNAITSTKSVKQKKWQCKICHKSYNAMNLLMQHTQSVHDKESFSCTFKGCSKIFTTENGAKSHLK